MGSATLEFENFYMLYRAAYNRLSAEAVAWGVTRWPVRPKDHYHEHAVFDLRGRDHLILNMRFCQKYVNEDFMRRTKQLAIRSHQSCLSKHVIFRSALRCL